MLKIFKLKPYYFRIYKNKVEIKDLEADKTIIRTSPIKFSSERLLIADFEVAEQFFRAVMEEFSENKIFTRPLKLVLQPMELNEDGLTSVEKRAFRDSGAHIGAKKLVIMNHTKYLSNTEFEEAFNNFELY